MRSPNSSRGVEIYREKLLQAIVRSGLAYVGFHVWTILFWFHDNDYFFLFLPSTHVFDFGLGCPLMLLSAVLERPFLTAAGIRRDALAISLQANAIGGIATGAFFWAMMSLQVLRPLAHWLLGAVPFWTVVACWAIATTLEYWYLARAQFDFSESAWRLIWTANQVSFFAVPVIYKLSEIIAVTIGNHLWKQSALLFWRWSRYGQTAYNVLVVVSAVLFGLSFVWPWLRRRFGQQRSVP